jgi:putative salt-induced outer membrane protein YdiY
MNTFCKPSVVCLLLLLLPLTQAQTDTLRLRDETSKKGGTVLALHAEGVTWMEMTAKARTTHSWDDVTELEFGTARSIAFGAAQEQVVGRVVRYSDGVLYIEGTLLGSLELRASDLPPRPVAPPVKIQEPKTPLKLTDWKGRLAVGSTLAAGNRDVLSGTLEALLEKDFRYDHFEVKLSAIYGQANSVVSNNSQTVSSRYKHFFSEDLYGFIGAELSRDPLKSLEIRGLLNIGLGWPLWNDGNGRSLNLEAGVGSRYESFGDESRNDGTARLAVYWNEVLFDDVTLKQKLEGIVPVGDYASWLGRSETVVSVPMNDSWSFRTSLKLEYQAVPAAGKDPFDALATTGLEFRF